jgi:hypothetical protein
MELRSSLMLHRASQDNVAGELEIFCISPNAPHLRGPSASLLQRSGRSKKPSTRLRAMSY